MIKTEYYMTRKDGVVLNRTYSDAEMMIERDGTRYSEAVDPIGSNRVYTETDEPILAENSTITDGLIGRAGISELNETNGGVG